MNNLPNRGEKMKCYLYKRKVGKPGTFLLERGRKEAMMIIRNKHKETDKLGIISGSSLKSIKMVYGEYAPFEVVNSLDELLNMKV